MERERFAGLNVENTQGSTFTQSCYSTQNYRLYSTTKYTLSHIHIYIHLCGRNQLLCMHVLYISTHACGQRARVDTIEHAIHDDLYVFKFTLCKLQSRQRLAFLQFVQE